MPRRRGCRSGWSRSTRMSKLDVPVDDLAVHEPDYKQLIAFLKAMEFTTLTRRVAEFSGIDAGEIEADAKLVDAARSRVTARRTPAAKPTARPSPERTRTRVASASRSTAAAGAEASGRQRRDRSRSSSRRRRSPPRGRGGAQGARSTARNTRPCARSTGSKAWVARATRSRRRRGRHRDHQPRSDAGAICAASRSRSRRTRPATCRSRIARAATASGGLFARRARARPDRGERRARRRSSRCWKTRACSRSART